MASKKQIQTTRVGTTRTCGCVWLGNSLLVRPQTLGRATWPPRKRASNNVILRFEPSKSMETFGGAPARTKIQARERSTKRRTTTPLRSWLGEGCYVWITVCCLALTVPKACDIIDILA